MPRTRKSSISSAINNNSFEEQQKQDSSLETTATDMILSPNACNMKKRTVSERSPAIKSRKKTTPVPSNCTPNHKDQTPIRMDDDKVKSIVDDAEDHTENKENRTPGPTPYWKVRKEPTAINIKVIILPIYISCLALGTR